MLKTLAKGWKSMGSASMTLVLLLVCIGLSLATIDRVEPTGTAAGEWLAEETLSRFGQQATVLLVSEAGEHSNQLAEGFQQVIKSQSRVQNSQVIGDPSDVRKALQAWAADHGKLDAIACSPAMADQLVVREAAKQFPALGQPEILRPTGSSWPRFLGRQNLLNIMGQIAVIAIVAVGMTLVVISGGIDLSVGSLVGLSAILTAAWIEWHGGGDNASTSQMVLGSLIGISVCAFIGVATGSLVAWAGAPPFLVTLGVMLIARGTAQQLTGGESLAHLPDRFVWLGRGADWGIPNAVILMLVLYALAEWILRSTVFGRHLLALGGNAKAAGFAGIPVRRVQVLAYLASGCMAGLGGVVLASQLKSASPTYGDGYELMVIAAVVVGGTSLAGGQGSLLGTLVGALLIAVINNGMNLLGIDPFAQKIVLGCVILLAVLLDRLRQR